MRVALIGLGHVAKHQIAALACIPTAQLTDAFDNNPEALTSVPDGTRLHTSLDSLIALSTADVFVISTPTTTHFEIATKLLALSKAVVLEKPACLQTEHLEALSASADRRSAFLHVFFHAAFARELIWWLDYIQHSGSELGTLLNFEAGFFDPYIVDSTLIHPGNSLVGSWYDSGINALSVIATIVHPEDLRLSWGRMTCVPSIPCTQVQGSACFTFSIEKAYRRGIVDTNWTLGLNKKKTTLFYENATVILDHTAELCTLIRGGTVLLQKSFRTNHPRLTNHYVGAFVDLQRSLAARHSNWLHAVKLHRLLFAAATFQDE